MNAVSPHALEGAGTTAATGTQAGCLHCGQPVAGASAGPYCCFGCRTVHGALVAAGLERFYALRGPAGEPVGELGLEHRDRAWLEPLLQTVAAAGAGTVTLRLRAQGIRCAACVWVLEKLFSRSRDAASVVVNPALGTLELHVGAGFDLGAFVDAAERCGYRLGAADAVAPASDDGLLLRFGVTAALALNAMGFGAAIHLGVEPGPLYELLQGLGYGAACLAVLVGAPVFFGSARRALARGVLHLDVPIALGIGLSFAAASWAYFAGHHDAAYFDSLAAFVALMLGGRWLQERAIAKNRRELLDDAGLQTLRARRLEDGRLHGVSYGALRAGDVLVLGPGELLPVEAELLDDAGSFSLEWISGEPEPRVLARGERVPAGAFNVGTGAVRARLDCDFAGSTLLPIVGAAGPAEGAAERLQAFSTRYVIAVLALAAGGLAYHALVAGDVLRGVAVATAVCVVTCPCAVGVAVPLVYELAHAALRRRGLFVRSGSLLDRARRVRRVVFDKTGTLTTGKLRVLEPARLHGLPAAEREALYQLVARSLHPRSIAVRRELEADAPRFRTDVEVHELPGQGLEADIDGTRYRLGRAAWALWDATAGDGLVLSADGALRVAIPTAEQDRPDAREQLAALQNGDLEVVVLSGDAQERVATTAGRLGLPEAQALGGLTPADKAAWIDGHGAEETLMIGDGINDAPAARAALCSGTCAVDRALLPARTDFYFTTAGLSPVSSLLGASRDVAVVVRRTLALALAYNAITVAVALAGAMQPWLAAVLMPLSSVGSVGYASAALGHRSRAWKS